MNADLTSGALFRLASLRSPLVFDFSFLRLFLLGHDCPSDFISAKPRVQPIEKPNQTEPRPFEVSDQAPLR